MTFAYACKGSPLAGTNRLKHFVLLEERYMCGKWWSRPCHNRIDVVNHIGAIGGLRHVPNHRVHDEQQLDLQR